jgi:CubicO group peptidase (beta-lactamase class C family)
MPTNESAADRRQFLAALAATAAMPSIAQAAAPGGEHAAVRAMVDRYVAEKKVANMVVAIGGKKGAPDFVSAGTLELGAGPLAGPDTLYRIYSMTKLVAGCAIMMLVEEDKLSLDTPLATIFPAYANMSVLTDPENSLATRPATKPILIRHLVTHSSGLAYDTNTPPLLSKLYWEKAIFARRSPLADEARRAPTLLAWADAAAAMPLMFEPGSGYRYSIGLDIAGAVVEKITGIPLDEFFAQQIFAPLGMVDTFFTVPATALDRLVANYNYTAGGITLLETGLASDYARKPSFPAGGGGLVSSARDFSKFMAMLLGEGKLGRARILKTKTARVMMSDLMEPGVVATTSSGVSGYGAGGRYVTTASPGGEAVGTFGWSGAAATQAFVDRETGFYTVLMTQVMNWQPSPVLDDLDRALYVDIASA